MLCIVLFCCCFLLFFLLLLSSNECVVNECVVADLAEDAEEVEVTA